MRACICEKPRSEIGRVQGLAGTRAVYSSQHVFEQRWPFFAAPKPEWRFDKSAGRCHISGSIKRSAKRKENCSRAGRWRERVVARQAGNVKEPGGIRLRVRGAGMTGAGVAAGAESPCPHFPYSCGDKSCFLGPDSRNARPPAATPGHAGFSIAQPSKFSSKLLVRASLPGTCIACHVESRLSVKASGLARSL
jgi:hypothetical protein